MHFVMDLNKPMICRWLECDRPAARGGWLCAAHLSKAIEGNPDFRKVATNLLSQLGMGVTVSILAGAIFKALEALGLEVVMANGIRFRPKGTKDLTHVRTDIESLAEFIEKNPHLEQPVLKEIWEQLEGAPDS